MPDTKRPSQTRCSKVELTDDGLGRACHRAAHFQVNGVLSCVRHLSQQVVRYSVASESGHLWASVQVLPVTKGSYE